MKAYSIGRETGCDIVINDNTNVISRRHAILNVTSSGKMTIIDQSQNGTYVNGIRISANVPVPVTRKDNISFAHIAKLDWNMIPKEANFLTWAAIGAGAIIVAVGLFLGIQYWQSSGSTTPASSEPPVMAPADTTKTDKQDTDKQDTDKTKETPSSATKKTQKTPQRPNKKDKDNTATKQESQCPVCKKAISKCEYKGKHPADNARSDR